jgi:hypothetical protein
LAPKTLACRVHAQPSTRQANAALPKIWLGIAFRDERRCWCAARPNALVLVLIRLAPRQVPLCSPRCRRRKSFGWSISQRRGASLRRPLVKCEFICGWQNCGSSQRNRWPHDLIERRGWQDIVTLMRHETSPQHVDRTWRCRKQLPVTCKR